MTGVRDIEMSAPGPDGMLAGTLTMPPSDHPIDDDTPVAVIVPGSGPTDRDGNSPLGISANTYRLLGEGLAANGVPTVRIDKRGMFGSKTAVPDANDVTIRAYGDDLLAWIASIRARLPRQDGSPRKVVPIGHSEGGLVVLAASGRVTHPHKMVLIACPGRPLADVLREQLRANPQNAEIMGEAEAAIASLEAGITVATNTLHPGLAPLFAEPVQPFLMDLFQYDPAALMRKTDCPTLVLQGTRDIQVSIKDAERLVDGARSATLAVLPDVTHVLKRVEGPSRDANLATYSDPHLPIAMEVIERILAFLDRPRAPQT